MLDNIKIAVIRLPKGETATQLLIDSLSEDFKFMYDKDRNVIGMYLTFEVGENKDIVETDNMDIIDKNTQYLELADRDAELYINRLNGHIEDRGKFLEAISDEYGVIRHGDIPVAIYAVVSKSNRELRDGNTVFNVGENLLAMSGGGSPIIDDDDGPRGYVSEGKRKPKGYAKQAAVLASVLGMGSLNGSGAAKLASELSGYNIDAFDKMSKYNDKKVQDIYNVIHKKLGGYWSGRFIKLSTIESKYALSYRLKITDADGNLVGEDEWKTNQK